MFQLNFYFAPAPLSVKTLSTELTGQSFFNEIDVDFINILKI